MKMLLLVQVATKVASSGVCSRCHNEIASCELVEVLMVEVLMVEVW